MTHLYNFGLSQEDELTEAAALKLQPEDCVLSVASAGDMPLSLLSLGAGRVIAVDVDPNQVHLARLKVAAVQTLSREIAIRFLGFMQAPPASRRQWLGIVLPALPEASQRFWRAHPAAVARGAIWAGRYERYVRFLIRAVWPFVRGKVNRLFECRTTGEQSELFDRTVDRFHYRAMFRLAFHPRVYARRGMDPQSLKHLDAQKSVGEQFFERFRALCTQTPARENHLLQLHLLGRVLGPDTVPAYLSPKGFERTRDGLNRLEIHHADLCRFIEDAPPDAFRKVHLSNLPDWFGQAAFERVFHLIVKRAAKPARVVWRYLHVDRSLPPPLDRMVRQERDLGRQILATDRFPVYTIIPAQIDA